MNIYQSFEQYELRVSLAATPKSEARPYPARPYDVHHIRPYI